MLWYAMYAEETLGFSLKFKGFTSSSHHAANWAAVLLVLLRKFAVHFALLSGSALTTRHCKGHQPSPGWSTAHHLLRSIMRQCASMCTVEMPGSDIHSSPSKWLRCVPSCKVARNARASPTVPQKKLERQCDSKSWVKRNSLLGSEQLPDAKIKQPHG